MNHKWPSLVAEAQFANELVVLGLAKLCTVPTRTGLWGQEATYAHRYPLYVGLHSFTTGLERLCKLAIVCNGYLLDGHFPNVRQYSHKLATLLDRVGQLQKAEAVNSYPVRPKFDNDAGIIGFLEHFASGSGRYEYLDLLSKDQVFPEVYDKWHHFCTDMELSEEISQAFKIRSFVISQWRGLSSEGGLESSTYEMLERLDVSIDENSTALALRLFSLASWVASVVSEVTNYTHPDLPILGEVFVALRSDETLFFENEIALLGDVQAVVEEIEVFLSERPEESREDD